MKKYLLSVLIVLLVIPISALGQKWKKERYELIFGVGTSHFFGDLGGGEGQGQPYVSFEDMDWEVTKPSFQLGFRYKIFHRLYYKLGVGYGQISGSDEFSENPARRQRNLSFKSDLYEVTNQFEFQIIKENRDDGGGINYGSMFQNINLYVFGGVSGFYFNPKAEYQGEWYELQPLGTEGQGIGSNPPKYSLYQVAFPVGGGIKFYINKRWSIGVEIGGRFTLTDYIDDVSDSYYDNDAIRTTYGDIAAELADRRIAADGSDLFPVPSGTPYRGNPEYNDSYIFAFFNLTYTYRKYGRLFRRLGGSKSRRHLQKRQQSREKKLEKHRKNLENNVKKY